MKEENGYKVFLGLQSSSVSIELNFFSVKRGVFFYEAGRIGIVDFLRQ